MNSLQNMVVVVDESSADSSAYQQLEQQLESLGQRWANVCKWVDEQWQILQVLIPVLVHRQSWSSVCVCSCAMLAANLSFLSVETYMYMHLLGHEHVRN